MTITYSVKNSCLESPSSLTKLIYTSDLVIFNSVHNLFPAIKGSTAARWIQSPYMTLMGGGGQGPPPQGTPSQGTPSQGTPSQGTPSQVTPSQGTTTPSYKPCGNKEFQCHSYDECIPNAQVCNGLEDCKDKSDEANCGSHCETRKKRSVTYWGGLRPFGMAVAGVDLGGLVLFSGRMSKFAHVDIKQKNVVLDL